MSAFLASHILIAALFAVFAIATIAGALLAVLTRWIIRSVCGLALTSVGLAGLFYFLGSPFVAMIQILIYIGAVCITIVFAIMLAEPSEQSDRSGKNGGRLWMLGAGAVAALLFAGLAVATASGGFPEIVPHADSSVAAIGIALLTKQLLAFELVAIVLLVAILGALAVARKGRTLE